MSQRKPIASQAGVMLLESLVAMLIFSIGILGIVSLQGTAVKQATDARYRSDASFLANQLLGQMWLEGGLTAAALQDQFNTDRPKYDTWKRTVIEALPGVADNPPTVVVGADYKVTVTVKWLAPTEPTGTPAHQYVVTAKIMKS